MTPTRTPPELFTIRVPCDLHSDGQHDIAIQLAHHNWVSFRFTCNRRPAEAAAALSATVITCQTTINILREAIRDRNPATITVGRCHMCDVLVAVPSDRCILPTHFAARRHIEDLPFWERLCRVGRVR